MLKSSGCLADCSSGGMWNSIVAFFDGTNDAESVKTPAPGGAATTVAAAGTGQQESGSSGDINVQNSWTRTELGWLESVYKCWKDDVVKKHDGASAGSLLRLAKASIKAGQQDQKNQNQVVGASFNPHGSSQNGDTDANAEDGDGDDDDPEVAVRRMLAHAKLQTSMDQLDEAYLVALESMLGDSINPVQPGSDGSETTADPFNMVGHLDLNFNGDNLDAESSLQTFTDVISTWMDRGTRTPASRKDGYIQLLFHLAAANAGGGNAPTQTPPHSNCLPIRDAPALIALFYQLAITTRSIDAIVQGTFDGPDQADGSGNVVRTEALKNSTKASARLVGSLEEFVKTHAETPDIVTIGDFQSWASQQFPSLPQTLSIFMERIVFGTSPIQSRTNVFPTLQNCNKDSMLKTESTLFTIASMMPRSLMQSDSKFQPSPWNCLYDSGKDGWSSNRLEHAVQGYKGETLMLVQGYDTKTSTVVMWGGLATSAWKKSADFFGKRDCFAFMLRPQVEVYHATPTTRRGGGNYQYFHSNTGNGNGGNGMMKTNAKSGTAQGIGFGGSAKQPRFFVSAALDTSYIGKADTSFEDSTRWLPFTPEPGCANGRWLELEGLEVWGLGGATAMEALDSHRDRIRSHLDKARKVDKAAFLGDLRSGLIENKLFVHREQMRGRDGGGDALLDGEDE